MHAHRDPTRTDNALDTSSAVSGGVDVANQYSEWTIINNLFYDVDHAVLNKGGGRFIFVNNTLVHVNKENGGGIDSDIAAFDFTDNSVPLPNPSIGSGAYIAGNIIWDTPRLTANYNSANHTVIFNDNLLQMAWTGPGSNNVVADPQLNLSLIGNVAAADWKTVQAAFKPRLGSPALGTGIGGFDKGGMNPRGLLIYGEPPKVTSSTSATLNLASGGTFNWGTVVPPYAWGYTHYRWKLDSGPWSAETSITTSPVINLTGLANGSHTVFVSGKNDAGFYQDDSLVYPATAGIPGHVTVSRSWVVSTGAPPVQINEVLARNNTAVPVGTKFPDLIELYNSGSTPVSLAGMGFTDERTEPFKFVFPTGTTIGSRQYLVLYADSETTPAGIHLGFQLDADGDDVYLYSAAGRVIDSIKFGLQIPDLSIGRMVDGSWGLTRPTFGAANLPQLTGDQFSLKINEWLADGRTVSANDFIELYNPTPLPVSLGGMFLTDNPIGAPDLSEIPPLSFIAANGFSVFIADGDPEDGANHVNFSLAPEKGMIGLASADSFIVDCIVYGPQTTDISEGRSPNGANTMAFFATPTPGSPNPSPFVPGGTQIVLSEITANNVNGLTNRVGNNADWIELYNPSNNIVDLFDMSVSDTAGNARRFVFPVGSRIPARGYYVLFCDKDSAVSTNNTGFGLESSGGAVFLFDRLAAGGSLIGSVSYGIQAPDFSIGVTVGGTNWMLMLPTPGFLNSAASLGNPMLLKVNEWMPNPSAGEDWFEIFNPNSQPVALGGLNLSDTTADLKKSPIPALSFIASGLYGFQRFWADNNVPAGADHANFKLNNSASGESVAIATKDGALIDSISYTSPPLGISRGRLPDGGTNVASFPASPTPGESNFLPLDNVVINEVLTHSDPPYEDAIELHNISGASVNIGGWYLSDAKHFLKKYRITNGTSIASGGFKVYYENQFNPQPPSAGNFSLNSAKGDELYLSAANTNGDLTGFRTSVKFGAAENGVSFGRFTTSLGLEFVALSQHTFGVDAPDNVGQFRGGAGLSNAYPKVGPIVISEIMYHPASDDGTNTVDEFIELHNIGVNPVPLYHPSYPSNTWRFRDAVSFDFPPNITISNGQYLLVVSFNPLTNATALAAFRSRYNLPTSVAIVGPYSGKLDNGSDKVELYKPDAPQQPPDPDAGFVPYILVDRVVYSDSFPWPVAAGTNSPDGGGASLQRVSEPAFGNDPVNWIAAAPTPAPAPILDSDNDGMPDWYENDNGLLPNNSADALLDKDGDGMNNLSEYRAGTRANDANSVLKLQVIAINPIRLQFAPVPNKSYRIEVRESLNPSTPWGLLVPFDGIPNPPAVYQYTDGLARPNRFYQIRTPQ